MASSARVAAFLDGTSGGGDGGGKEPELKRRKLLDAGGPVEDDETARQKMRDARVYERGLRGTPGVYVGFDPDNVRDVKSFDEEDEASHAITAMGYFAELGDLPMMRWLYVNGADTRDVDVAVKFPLWMAALNGNFVACKWLFAHGATEDIKGRTSNGYTPLSAIFYHSPFRDLSRWLILKGALCKDDGTGDLDADLMRSNLNRFAADSVLVAERRRLLEWAKEHHQSRSSLKTFLMGTLSGPTYSVTKLHNELLSRIRSEEVVDRLLRDIPQDEYHLLWNGLFPRRDCLLVMFSGTSGILELIGDYVGIMLGREARIVRQLTELLPGLFVDLAAVQAESSDESDESDDSE